MMIGKSQVIVEQARVYGCVAEVDFFEEKQFYPPTVNDEEMVALVKEVAVDLLGPDKYWTAIRRMGAEDFSFYSQIVPSAFFYVGTMNKELGSDENGHSPLFMIDEDALPTGATIHSAIAERYLSQRASKDKHQGARSVEEQARLLKEI